MDVPEDILLRVFDILYVPPPRFQICHRWGSEPWLQKSDLPACARVCKAWLFPVRRVLYGCPVFCRREDEALFLQSIRLNGELANLVRRFDLSMQNDRPLRVQSVASAVEGIFQACPNIGTVVIRDISNVTVRRILDALIASPSRKSLTSIVMTPVMSSRISTAYLSNRLHNWPNLTSLTIYHSSAIIPQEWPLVPTYPLTQLKLGYSKLTDWDLWNYLGRSGVHLEQLILQEVEGLSQDGFLGICDHIGRHRHLKFLGLQMTDRWPTVIEGSSNTFNECFSSRAIRPPFFYELVQLLPSLEGLQLSLSGLGQSSDMHMTKTSQRQPVPLTLLDVLPLGLKRLVFIDPDMPIPYDHWHAFFRQTVPKRHPALESAVLRIIVARPSESGLRLAELVDLAKKAGVDCRYSTKVEL